MADRTQLPRRTSYGTGTFRRRIVVESSPGIAVAELEDDYHHFGVEIRFDDGQVTSIEGVSERYPWTTCPSASNALAVFVGARLEHSLPAIAARCDADRQCTHQLDLACLAIASASLGIASRRYDATIPEPRDGVSRVELAVDDEPRIAWTLHGMTISDPEPFSGQRLGSGFAAWVEREFSAERALEIHLLRRATFIGFGRQYDFDAMPNPIEFAAATRTRCYSFHPEQVERAERMVGSSHDYDDRPQDLLRDSCLPRRRA
jgi:hypothetical protein